MGCIEHKAIGKMVATCGAEHNRPGIAVSRKLRAVSTSLMPLICMSRNTAGISSVSAQLVVKNIEDCQRRHHFDPKRWQEMTYNASLYRWDMRWRRHIGTRLSAVFQPEGIATDIDDMSVVQ